jgi:hypothetical protein
MNPLGNEDLFEEGLTVDNFTEFFFNLDDETLAIIAYKYPQALVNMCMFLTLDQQLRREELKNKITKIKFVN